MFLLYDVFAVSFASIVNDQKTGPEKSQAYSITVLDSIVAGFSFLG